MELGAAAAIVGIYGGAMYSYYRFLVWLEGPKRRSVGNVVPRNGYSSDDELFGPTYQYSKQVRDEKFLDEYDLDLPSLKHMDPEDKMRYVDAKLKGITCFLSLHMCDSEVIAMILQKILPSTQK